jgi:hypothetical protein
MLYLEDLSDFIVECVDEKFWFQLPQNVWVEATVWMNCILNLKKRANIYRNHTQNLEKERVEEVEPKLICFSCHRVLSTVLLEVHLKPIFQILKLQWVAVFQTPNFEN